MSGSTSRQKNTIASSLGSQSIDPVNTSDRLAGGLGHSAGVQYSVSTPVVTMETGRRMASGYSRWSVWLSASETASTPSKRASVRRSYRSMRRYCMPYRNRRPSVPVFVSAWRRQISDSTLCVKMTAGHGSGFGRLTAGNRKSHTIEVEGPLVQQLA